MSAIRHTRPRGRWGSRSLRARLAAAEQLLRQAEERRAAAERQLYEIFDKLAAGVVEIDPDGYYRYVNRRAAADFGLTPGEVIGKSLADILPPTVAQTYLERNRRFIAEQAYVEREEVFDTPQGPRTFVVADQVLSDAQGVGRALLASTIDITARKADEESLRRSERTFRELYAHMRDAFVSVDMDGRIRQYNRSFQEMLGYRDEELLGMTYRDITPEQWHGMEIRLVHEEILPHGYSPLYEKEYRRKDGSIVPIELRAVLIDDAQGQPAGMWAIVRDITERRQAQALVLAQRDLARLLATTVDTTADAWPRCLDLALRVTGLDCGGIYLFDPAEQALDLVCHQGLRAAFLHATAHYAVDLPHVQRILAGGPAYYAADNMRQSALFQSEALTCVAIMPIHHQGKVLGAVNLASHTLPEVPAFARQALETIAPEIGNIVVALRTAEALRESQLRVELALQGGNLGTWDWEVQTGRTVFDERWAAIVGYTLAELAPVSISTWENLCHPDDLTRSNALLAQHFAGETAFYECEVRMRHKSGAWVWIIDRGKVVTRDAAGLPLRMAGTHRDITARKQAEFALRASEEHYRGLIESLDTTIAAVDATGTFRYLNQVAAQQLGGASTDFVGKTMALLFPAAVAEHQLAAIRTAIRDDRVIAFENLSLVRGEPRWYRTTISPIHDDTGQVIYTLINATDIHDLKTVQQELRELNQTLEARVAERTAEVQDLYDQAPVAYHSLDAEGKLVRVNQTTLTWLGYTRDELIGRPMTDFLTGPDREQFPVGFALLRERGWVHDIEQQLVRKDGSTFPVVVSATAVYDATGAFVMTRTTLTDITERKQAEEALHEANAELARAARAKDEFLATMSHELRTPLNAILGYSESLQDAIYGPITARQQAAIHAIETSGGHLLALINDILDLSKVEAGQLTLVCEPVDIAGICQASLQFVKEAALKKSLQITVILSNPLLMMEADPRRLKQMLVNLLSNAVKFTPDGGQVSLEVTLDAAAGLVRFAVRDTGIGIAPEQQARLFQPFVQLDSRLSRQHVGTGLGLALVRRLAEAHGGSVALESDVGVGSRFTLVLPQYPQGSTILDARRSGEHHRPAGAGRGDGGG